MRDASRCTVTPEGHSGNARSAQLTQNLEIVSVIVESITMQGHGTAAYVICTCVSPHIRCLHEPEARS